MRAYTRRALVASRRRTAAATRSIRARADVAVSANTWNLPAVRAIAARSAATRRWKSKVDTSHSRKAEKPSQSRWIFHAFASITSDRTRAWRALMVAAASSSVVWMTLARSVRSVLLGFMLVLAI
ncbi:hypothetical protein GCM10028833_16540 [Glycomyces tarimensis]